jgi:putative autoinducer-2 (AI-2) aldolase
VYDGMQRGASGLNLGRNVWQNPNPVPMMRALEGIIHGGLTNVEANELFEELKRA